MRKKLFFLAIILLFLALCKNVFGQNKTYPFEFTKSGQGTSTIIFIPGFASSGDVWNGTKAIFEKDHTCYVLTMAGFAGTKPQPDASFKNWESAIADFIKDNHLEKPIVIGHSMGGGLALALAADYPDLIKKIVVVDALPCLAAMRNPDFKAKKVNDCSDMVKQITAQTHDQFYMMQRMSIAQLMADSTKQAMVIGWSMQSDRKTFAEMYCDFMNTDLRQKIKTITCPSLILLEAYFKNAEDAVKDQYKQLRSADIRYSTKGLHFIMYDDPEWYFSQVSNFVPSK